MTMTSVARSRSLARSNPARTHGRSSVASRCKDGSYVWLSCSCAAPPADDPLVFAICRDVTRWKQAEDALQVAQQQLLQILDNTSAVIYVKQLDGRYLLVNRQYERLFNVTRDEVLSLTDDDLFPPEVAEAFRDNDRLVAETEDVITMEEIAPHPDGPHTYISVKFPLRDASGRVYAVAGISTDISQRARAEQELAATKNRLELILDAISEGVIGVDSTGEITFLNTAAEQLLDASHAAERRTVRPETRNLVDLLKDLDPGSDGTSREIELKTRRWQDGIPLVFSAACSRQGTTRRKRHYRARRDRATRTTGPRAGHAVGPRRAAGVAAPPDSAD